MTVCAHTRAHAVAINACAPTDLLTNLKEWEEHDAAIKRRHAEMQTKVQELEALKREMRAQLERLRVDEQYPLSRSIALHVCMSIVHLSIRCLDSLVSRTSSKASLESLLEKYEETRLHVAQYALQHEHDIPFAKCVHRQPLAFSLSLLLSLTHSTSS